MVRRMLTDPKTAFAGVILETSFARFVASMATFSEEIILPRSFGRCDLVFMVKSEGRCENTTRGRRARTPIEMGVRLAAATRLSATQQFDEQDCIGDGGIQLGPVERSP